MSPNASFGLIDILILAGLVFSAIVGGIYFFSPSFRSDKRREWEKEGEMKAVSEWGEWLLGLLVVIIFLGAAIGYALQK